MEPFPRFASPSLLDPRVPFAEYVLPLVRRGVAFFGVAPQRKISAARGALAKNVEYSKLLTELDLPEAAEKITKTL